MSVAKKSDTIVAISTPIGEGGIGVIRLSGEDAIPVAERIFVSPKKKKLSEFASHTVHFGHIVSHGDTRAVDEVLVAVMRAPHTYTAEDVVEISCHGGMVPLRNVMELCINEGARVAEPGEFTKRAFMNGRIDLSQAEAVIDIIKSESDASCRVAIEQLDGNFSKEIKAMRQRILDIIAQIELAVDFTDEDVEFASIKSLTCDVLDLAGKLKKLLATSEKGMMIRRGIKIVICGKPNVGKSSLMNALLGHDRVIVAPHAGTTRDVVEEYLNIGGMTVRISDTAGIGKAKDMLDGEGMKRSREKLKHADLVLFVVDAAEPLSCEDDEIYQMICSKKHVIVLNKTDLANEENKRSVKERFSGEIVVDVSVLHGEGIEEVEKAASRKILDKNIRMPEGPVVTNARHKAALEKALESVERGSKFCGRNYNGELLASDLNEALYQLGLITGETIEDDVLDRIFSQFCIGK